MTTEALQQQEQVTEVQPSAEVSQEQATEQQAAAPAEQSDDAAFQSGFDTARGNEPELEPEEPKRFAGYTEDELRVLLSKVEEVDKLKERESKVFGALGGLKRSIEEIRNQPKQAQPAAALDLKGKLNRLSAEFPEMAALLTDDLAEALQQPSGVGVDPEAFGRAVDAKFDNVSKGYELKLLTVMHRDWKQVVQEPAFEQWKATLPPDQLQVVNDSWDAISVGETLTAFKEWKNKTTQTKQNRQSRLESAIAPKGNPQMAPSLSDEDAFVKGFKSVRGTR